MYLIYEQTSKGQGNDSCLIITFKAKRQSENLTREVETRGRRWSAAALGARRWHGAEAACCLRRRRRHRHRRLRTSDNGRSRGLRTTHLVGSRFCTVTPRIISPAQHTSYRACCIYSHWRRTQHFGHIFFYFPTK